MCRLIKILIKGWIVLPLHSVSFSDRGFQEAASLLCTHGDKVVSDRSPIRRCFNSRSQDVGQANRGSSRQGTHDDVELLDSQTF
jgi:hypothetical protein